MKVFKKLAFMLALAMMISTTAPAASTFNNTMVAMAADPTNETINNTNITIDYTNENLNVSVKSGTTVYYTDKHNAEKASSTVWEEVKATSADAGASIDISWLKATADSVIYVTIDKKNIYPVKIAKQETTLGAYFVGDTTDVKVNNVALTEGKLITSDYGAIYFTLGAKTSAVQTEKTNIEWKKGSAGKWQSIDKFEIKDYVYKGATIYFRIKATDSTDDGTLKDGVYVYDGNRASKEVKVTIAKQANAPALKIDATKLSIGFKLGQEYRILESASTWGSWTNVSTFVNAETKKLGVVTLNDLSKYTYKDFDGEDTTPEEFKIQIRTAASLKKTCSKITTVTLLKPSDVATIKSGSLLTVAYTKAYDSESGLTFKNASETANLQVAVIDAGKDKNENGLKFASSAYSVDSQADLSVETIKWTTVKAKGTGKIAVKTYKDMLNPVIVYRYAPVAEDKETDVVEYRVASAAAAMSMPTAVAQKLYKSGDDTKATSITENVTASTTAAKTATITLAGENITETGAKAVITKKSGGDGVTLKAVSAIKNADSKLTATVAKGTAAGNYVFEVKVESVTLTVTITVAAEPTATPTPTPEVSPTPGA